jgi:thiamine-phosphate pyrophosphorylase
LSADPTPRPARLYGIADVGQLGAEATADAVDVMAAAGLRTLQIRAKRLDDRRLGELCEAVTRRLEGWPGQLWIDDRADLARIFGFAGVHLGQRDLAPSRARWFAGPGCAVGLSTHDRDQLADADADAEVDWIAIGPIFATASKEAPDAVVGLAALSRLRAGTRKPLVAIGGIDAANAAEVLAAGADSVAILSALCRGDVEANCRALLRAVGEEDACASC